MPTQPRSASRRASGTAIGRAGISVRPAIGGFGEGISMSTAIRIIRDEHAALVAVLRSIGLLLAESRRRSVLPDVASLRAMLFYIDEFPEKVHHTKESGLLFPMLRKHTKE